MVMKAVACAGLSASNRGNTLRLALPMVGVLLPGPDQTGFILIVRHDGPKEL